MYRLASGGGYFNGALTLKSPILPTRGYVSLRISTLFTSETPVGLLDSWKLYYLIL